LLVRYLLILIAVLLSFGQPVQAEKQAVREFIIDTDVGPDDVIALAYFIKQPNIKIKAIAVDGDGNAHRDAAYANTMSILKLLNRSDIPVAAGRANSYPGGHSFSAAVMHDMDTLGGLALNKENLETPKQTAKELMIETLTSSDHPINILAIGPLTTIAEVLTEKPNLKSKIKMIYEMGGAVQTEGNIFTVNNKSTNHAAEWNIYFDPLAAKIVFQTGVPITLIPLDATNQVRINDKFYQQIKNHHKTPAAKLVYDLLTLNKKFLYSNTWYFWDPMAAVVAADESVATIKTLPLTVLLSPEDKAGGTVIDKKNGNNIRVCMKVNAIKFKENLLRGLSIP